MEKDDKNKENNAKQPLQGKKRALIAACAAVIALAAAVCVYTLLSGGRVAAPDSLALYEEKIAALSEQVLTDETRAAVGENPAGSEAKQAVFISVCGGQARASVFCGTGEDLDAAWDSASGKAGAWVGAGNCEPLWVKADVVFTAEAKSREDVNGEIEKSRDYFYRYGIAFDGSYKTALLEAELNGAKIYDYEENAVDLDGLNGYLEAAGRKTLEKLPDEYTLFQTLGWICDEDKAVYELYSSGLEYGRRQLSVVDGDYARWLIKNGASFLAQQVKEDGAFIYGISPCTDRDLTSYNILRHAGTTWALLLQYRVSGDKSLEEPIRQAIEYLVGQVVYQDDETAYVYEAKSDEIKLGGCGIGILALTEYMDVFQNTEYIGLCEKLGNGIVALMNEDGGYWHVLNADFSRKEEYRTVYYDGEASFALCRLYSATKDERWLEYAKRAVDHFIEADYTQYMDHWVAYTMNEFTKYVEDPVYYAFGLRNAKVNLEKLTNASTASHIYLELLMATFEMYDRAVENGKTVRGFEIEDLIASISFRVHRQLNGYFYPEYAMYMANPARVLNTFMVRQDAYRVRIDDVQHNIGGYYLYLKNYDRLVSYGLLEIEEAGGH